MRVTGEKPGIIELLHQDVLTSRLKREILDFPVLTPHGYAICFEFHMGHITADTVLRNYQYAIDLRVEVGVPVKPHFVSLDENKTPIPKVELFPKVFTNPKVTFLADIGGEKALNNIKDKLEKQLELDENDAYYLSLLPFFSHEKSREEMLEYMCHFINDIEISEEYKYIIKLIQILSVNAIFTGEKQKEFLGVIKMESTYIERYERNLIESAVNKAVNEAVKDANDKAAEEKMDIIRKMKADGVSSDFIFKYFDVIL